MALVRFGGGVSELRGSIAGNTFSRSRAGATVRNRITPVNPNTQAQADVRYLFAQIADLWSSRTITQREEWDTYAQMITLKNRLGEDYTPSGRQMFQECNTNLALTTAALNPGPPTSHTFDLLASQILVPNFSSVDKPEPPEFAGGDKNFNLTINAGVVANYESIVNFVPPSIGLGDKQVLIVEATPVMNASVRSRKNMYRLLAAFDASSAAILDIVPEWNIVFGGTGYVSGQVGMVRLKTVNNGGRASDWVEITAVAV